MTRNAPSTAAMPPLADPSALSPDQVRRYREDGVVALPSVVPSRHLELLRAGCAGAIARADRAMDARGADVDGLSRRGSRYFIAQPSLDQRELFAFIASPLLAGICRALLGDDVWVFYEQYVVKGPETGMAFSWHQDSGYVGTDTPHRPYLTCWVALDDMSEENGTVHVLPAPRAGIRSRVEHIQDPAVNDLVGYFGSDPGDPVLCPAGSIACFSSVTFHRSGWNRTPRLRRTYVIQYAGQDVRRNDGAPWGRTERLLDGGRLVLRADAPGAGPGSQA